MDNSPPPENPPEPPPKKLCLNCAYRANCAKRFGVDVVNGQVLCMEHTFDLMLLKSKSPGGGM